MYGYGKNHLGKSDLKKVDIDMNFGMQSKSSSKNNIFGMGSMAEIPTGGLYNADNGSKVIKKIGMKEGKKLRGLTKRRMR